MQYAGFWRRFGAMWVDALVMLPLVAISIYFQSSRLFELYWLIPGTFINVWFSVYLVYRYGGTPGKLLLGTRITMVDGSAVTARAALLRYSVLFALSLLSSIGLILASLAISDSDYAGLGYIDRALVLQSHAPSWYGAVYVATNVWFWSEFVTMLFNEKRRAIHDFIAGTVVVKIPTPVNGVQI